MKRLVPLVIAMGAQAGLLILLRTDPDSFPAGTGLVVIALSFVAAGVLGLDAYRYRDQSTSWWSPDPRRWAVAGAIFGANIGFAVAYYLRRLEAARTDGPSGWWKLPVVGSVIVTSVGTALVNVYFDLNDLTLTGAAILFGLLVIAGFTFVAVFYETRYISRALDHGGSGWLFDGYHWVALVGLPIPGRLVFVLLYLFRRRMLLVRVADEGEDIDTLATGIPEREPDDEDVAVSVTGDEPGPTQESNADAATTENERDESEQG